MSTSETETQTYNPNQAKPYSIETEIVEEKDIVYYKTGMIDRQIIDNLPTISIEEK